MKFREFTQRPFSLTFRLSLLFGITALIVFVVFGWLIEDSINRHFTLEDVSELDIVANAVNNAIGSNLTGDNLALLERRLDDILVGHHGASLLVTDSTGQALYFSGGPDLAGIRNIQTNAVNEGLIDNWTDGNHTFRVLTKELHYNSTPAPEMYTITVAVPIDHHLRFIEGFRYTLWAMIVGSITITSLMGWIAVRQGHAPLRNIIVQIRRISTNELNTRLSPESVPGELTELASSFNEMLERLQESFIRLSNFSADIAHELRTPVTNLMTQTQVALSKTRDSDEYREILYSNMEEYEHMTQMIGDMLFLARADNGLCKPNNTDVDLALEVSTLFDYYAAWADERNIMLAISGYAKVIGDRLMLQRALNNLLANAIRHAPSGGTVSVELNQDDNHEIHIDVKNPGKDIASEHINRLFDRYYRVSQDQNDNGTGLGMAIVKTIIDAHGGEITVTSTDGITCFRIRLPFHISEPLKNLVAKK